ncbi:MAG: heme-copper oxidase subunit III [Pyrinomonadaceae bacterium]
MQVGTAETEIDERVIRRMGSRVLGSGTSGGNGQNGGGSNGGGGDGPGKNRPDLEGDEGGLIPDKSRILTWFLLLVVLMTFGGLIGAYVVLATNRALEWKPFDLPFQVWISTAIILASSICYEVAYTAIRRGHHESSKRFLVATTALGGLFISSQIIVWLALVNRGLYMRGNPYAGFFYILTAVHAVHVLGGVIALGTILLKNWYRTLDDRESVYRISLARSVGWYWHFMGVLWVVLIALLAFWK